MKILRQYCNSTETKFLFFTRTSTHEELKKDCFIKHLVDIGWKDERYGIAWTWK